jgi:hypothetical protein
LSLIIVLLVHPFAATIETSSSTGMNSDPYEKSDSKVYILFSSTPRLIGDDVVTGFDSELISKDSDCQ